MAQLKDTVVQGSLRATDTIYTTTAQIQILNIPTASNGTTYGPGTNGQVLKTNGSSIYWAADNNDNNYVTQNAMTTANTIFPIILANGASTTTAAVTNTVNKASTLTYNPSTKVLTVGNLSLNGDTGVITGAKFL